VLACVTLLHDSVPPPTEEVLGLPRWVNCLAYEITRMTIPMAKIAIKAAMPRNERSLRSWSFHKPLPIRVGSISAAACLLIEPLRYRGSGFLRMRAPSFLSLLMLLPVAFDSNVSKLSKLWRSATSRWSKLCSEKESGRKAISDPSGRRIDSVLLAFPFALWPTVSALASCFSRQCLRRTQLCLYLAFRGWTAVDCSHASQACWKSTSENF
jgi:hypothetical protein